MGKAINQHRRASRFIPSALLYLWWFALSGSYLSNFWSKPLVAGADGSGHVAVLHLYAKHIYPGLEGWIPELFGGMPFPVYYPPLFYWFGATVMALTGIDATLSAKLLTTISFSALPGTLYLLGRKVGLSAIEAAIAASTAGVVACGSNVVSLSGLGLLGLFEVGLFTQTLGFVLFCLWAACLTRAGCSAKSTIGAMAFLVVAILSNAHVLPLIAIYALTWLVVSRRSKIRQTRATTIRFFGDTGRRSLLLIGPLFITGIWLVPLLAWYRYSVGQPLSPTGLFNSLGSLNIVWMVCAYVAWHERDRLPHLSSLCGAVLIAAIVSLTPLADYLKDIPFQPPRLIAEALLLCTIPIIQMAARVLTEVFGGKKAAAHVVLIICTLTLALVHPIQRFGISAFGGADAEQIDAVRAAVRQLPPGKVLVEIVEPKAIFNSPENRTRELALSRALTHGIASDGRPVLWSVFREQSMMAPYATAVSNLFSTTKETFGLNGIALQRSAAENVILPNRLLAASSLNVAFFLVKTSKPVEALRTASSVRLLWEINGWTLFANLASRSADVEPAIGLPVFAWLPAKSKSRSADEVDLFNLGEQLSFEGFSDITVLWALSEGVDVWDSVSKIQNAVAVIDPRSFRWTTESYNSLMREGRKLRVILLDDGSSVAAKIDESRQIFASYKQVRLYQTRSEREVLDELVHEIGIQAQSETGTNMSPRVWRITHGYFPTWRTADGRSSFLTGQGSAAVLSAESPSFQWQSWGVRLVSVSVCLLGFLISFVGFRGGRSDDKTEAECGPVRL